MGVQFGPGEQPLLAQLGDDRSLSLRGREPAEALGHIADDPPVLADHTQLGQAMSEPDLEVVGIVTGRDLQRAGAELGLDVVVGDDRQLAADQRQDRGLADQPAVAWVVRIDRDRDVGEHRLGPDGCDRDRALARRERIVDVVERVGHIVAILDLEVRDRGPGPRVPVDDVPVSVDVALLIQGDKHPQHSVGVLLVEREALVLVVAGGAEALELADDLAAVLGTPLPDSPLELLPPECLTARALGQQQVLDLLLGGDPGVVGADDPLGALAEHPVVADQRVHDRVLERVPHVQRAGHVGRRDRDRVVLCGCAGRLGVEQTRREPLLDDPRLDLRRVIAGA